LIAKLESASWRLVSAIVPLLGYSLGSKLNRTSSSSLNLYVASKRGSVSLTKSTAFHQKGHKVIEMFLERKYYSSAHERAAHTWSPSQWSDVYRTKATGTACIQYWAKLLLTQSTGSILASYITQARIS